MEAKGGSVVTESELNKSSKSLKTTGSKGREHSDSLEYDPRIAEKLAALYEKLGGDIEAIFEVRLNSRTIVYHVVCIVLIA